MSEIIGIIERIVLLGQQIIERLEAHEEAVASLKRLEKILWLLKDVVNEITNTNVYKSHIVGIKDTLERTQYVYMKCAEDLNNKKKDGKYVMGKFKQAVGIYKAPNILADIQRTIKDVESHLSITDKSLSIIQRSQVSLAPTIVATSTSITTTTSSASVLGSELREVLSNTIDELVRRLKNDCQQLQEKLDRCTISIESSFFEGLESENPEAISFWKDRFGSTELNISSVAPYETMYVSWARFVHEIEVTFQLKNIPTATKEAYFGQIDDIRKYGNRYYIDPAGTRNLKDIRPLWLSALRRALDPLHKGYVKPHDFLSFVNTESLSNKLRQVVLDSCGYGIFVECQRTTSDIALPSELESPPDHVGWMSACQIISVPSSDELGIFIYDKETQPHFKNLMDSFTYPQNDVWVYVRYLQTGQIERKLLSKHVRMLGGLCVGASISIHYDMENSSGNWSDSLLIVELKACAGGRYIVTAGSEENTIVFVTKQPFGFNDRTVQSDLPCEFVNLPEFDYCLLGPSTIFTQEPKVGEKIQVRHLGTGAKKTDIKSDGLWYDVKVTAVNGDNVEYISTSNLNSPTSDTFTEDGDDSSNGDSNSSSDSGDYLGLSDALLLKQKKNNSISWCPWASGVSNLEVRPYRCLHIGDHVEAPVIYPDYLYNYHSLEESQLYLPARIMDVQGDQYLVKFSPAAMAYHWWPGRAPINEEFPRGLNSKETVKNLFDKTQVLVSMDRVRPYARGGSYPVLGTQSIRPKSWSAFQKVQFEDLQQIENILWK
ncbi:5884_t:CDS:2 [Entrophospora sp. SA101]|nr:5772_t:CDS:2 [Entrophospora sp. SA101]CAJ0900295.1 21660_t:CDS:2 [Entrophospora sp. SA101]CAJ0906581.1 5884_t:CDS:2 [Entrophospora sp. SA101]